MPFIPTIFASSLMVAFLLDCRIARIFSRVLFIQISAPLIISPEKSGIGEIINVFLVIEKDFTIYLHCCVIIYKISIKNHRR
jgi:hypothetical protein